MYSVGWKHCYGRQQANCSNATSWQQAEWRAVDTYNNQKKEKSELTSCIETFTEESKRHRTLIREELKQLVQEEKRRNDLFEKFIDTLAKK